MLSPSFARSRRHPAFNAIVPLALLLPGCGEVAAAQLELFLTMLLAGPLLLLQIICALIGHRRRGSLRSIAIGTTSLLAAGGAVLVVHAFAIVAELHAAHRPRFAMALIIAAVLELAMVLLAVDVAESPKESEIVPRVSTKNWIIGAYALLGSIAIVAVVNGIG